MKFTSTLVITALLATSAQAIQPVKLNQLDKTAKLQVKSHKEELDNLDEKIHVVEKMASGAMDEATIHAALDTLHGLYSPYHGMVAGWGSYMYPNENRWDPDHSMPDMITQEVTDAHKQLGYIRGLEAKLKGSDPNSGQN